MDLKAALIRLADTYCAATGMSKARLATILANDGKFFDRIEGGGSCTVRMWERCVVRLGDRWPAETPWPADVPRMCRCEPTPTAAAE